MLELLTVIGIIAALTGIVAIAFSVVGSNASARQTRVQLEACMSLQGEYENALGSLPISLKSGAVSATDLNSLPDVSPAVMNPSTGTFQFQQMMALIRQIPKNRDTEDKMSAASVEMFQILPWTTGLSYGKGVCATDAGMTYVCTVDILFPATSTTAPGSDAAHWALAPVPPPTLVSPRDGWNHAMRYVAEGLTNLKVDPNGAKKWYGAAASVPPGFDPTPIGPALYAPNHRPFWVSAGPDGNFETHDDNVYSFEN